MAAATVFLDDAPFGHYRLSMPNTYRMMLIFCALIFLQSCKTAKPPHKKLPPSTDFVELARRAYPPEGGRNTEYSDILWAELYTEPRWYFLMPPAGAANGAPVVQTIEGKAWYLAFTDPGKLKYYAKAHQLLDAKGNPIHRIMTPGQAVEFARRNGSGPVYGVRFNEGQKAGWSASLRELTLLPEYLKGRGLL